MFFKKRKTLKDKTSLLYLSVDEEELNQLRFVAMAAKKAAVLLRDYGATFAGDGLWDEVQKLEKIIGKSLTDD